MQVFILGSGSDGNALIVESDGARLLIDAGMGPRTLATRLRKLGIDPLASNDILAAVITHHHNDHIGHAEPLARSLRIPVYLHSGIHAPQVREKVRVCEYNPDSPFSIGPFTILAVEVPHDAPQVALHITDSEQAFFLATDLGSVPDPLIDLLRQSDLALVEANYCGDMLARGPYPIHLKRRITGGLGHLANEQTAELAAKLVGSRLSRLLLGHLSRTNNTPERALAAVRAKAGPLCVEVLERGVSYRFSVRISETPLRKAIQQALPLRFA